MELFKKYMQPTRSSSTCNEKLSFGAASQELDCNSSVTYLQKSTISCGEDEQYKNEAMRLLQNPPVKDYSFSWAVEKIEDTYSIHEIINHLLIQAAQQPIYEGGFSKLLAMILSSKKIDLNQRWMFARYPLHRAVELNLVSCVKVLLDHKADTNCVEIFEGKTPLHYVKSQEMTQILLENKGRVGLPDVEGNTPLHVAPSRVVSLLIENAAPLDSKNLEMFNCIDSRQYPQISDCIFHNKCNNSEYSYNCPAKLCKAIKKDLKNATAMTAVAGIDDYYYYFGLTPLQKATKEGDMEKCQEIIKHSPWSATMKDIKTLCAIAQIQEYRTGNPVYKSLNALYTSYFYHRPSDTNHRG